MRCGIWQQGICGTHDVSSLVDTAQTELTRQRADWFRGQETRDACHSEQRTICFRYHWITAGL